MGKSVFSDNAVPIGQPYWWDGIDWPELGGDPPEQADLLVIGAGYTGLSAAIAAHDAGAKVVVIEASVPGKGASSRNGGMVGAHPRLGWDALKASYGAVTADAIFAESGAALDWVQNLIARENINCDYVNSGRIQLAYTQNHLTAQRVLVDWLDEKSAVKCSLVDAEHLAQEIVTPLYRGGLLFPEHGALHPAKYYLGLLNAVLRRDVPVIAQAPAISVQSEGAHKIVGTPKGAIKAANVVLATNGYTTKPFNWFMRRVFPIPSFLIATEPLSPKVIEELAPGGRMMVETRARHSYFRASPDGTRIIFGGRAAMVNVNLRTAALRLHDTMSEIWPSMKDTKISHVWTGNTGFSFGQMPVVGQHDGIHFAMGFSGSGTVLAPYLGAKAALQALGDPEGETAYSHIHLKTRWFHPGGCPHFLKGGEFWFKHWIDRRENQAARR